VIVWKSGPWAISPEIRAATLGRDNGEPKITGDISPKHRGQNYEVAVTTSAGMIPENPNTGKPEKDRDILDSWGIPYETTIQSCRYTKYQGVANLHRQEEGGRMEKNSRDALLSVPEAAKELNLSEKSVYAMCLDGRLPSMKVGTDAVRIRPSSLDEFYKQREAARKKKKS
jgi:excisionase family DNA binding protein